MFPIVQDLQDEREVAEKTTHEHEQDQFVRHFHQRCEDAHCGSGQRKGPGHKGQLPGVALLPVRDDLRDSRREAKSSANQRDNGLHLRMIHDEKGNRSGEEVHEQSKGEKQREVPGEHALSDGRILCKPRVTPKGHTNR